MALTNNNLEIIKALAKNDLHSARKAALASPAEDKSKKNAWTVDYYRKLLIGNASTMMANLPPALQTILVGESPEGFDPIRYFLRDAEATVVEDVIKMKRIADEMFKRRIPYKNTTLLHGESGTGKTELGRYIAYRLNMPFFYISFASTIDSYMGSTAKNIHKVFEFCNSIPCVLMLDEVDCIATRRDSGGSRGVDGELERTTISIMQELDRLPNHVTLIAATNRLDMVDEAMMRRFSIKHEIKPFASAEEMREFARHFLEATDTAQYAEGFFEGNKHIYNTPGALMPELIREIGKNLYEEKKDELETEDSDEEKLDFWNVTYTWSKTIPAETEEDAIAIARKDRTSYNAHGSTEKYEAKRAEYIVSNEKEVKGI